MNIDRKTKAVKWTLTTTRLPEPEDEDAWIDENVYDILMCFVYTGGIPDGDLEWFYEIGSFEDGKFLDNKNQECSPHYWAKINEPHAWECE